MFPQFIKYIVDVVFEGNLTEGRINLPFFLVSFFDSFEDQLTAVVIVGVSLVIYQLFRALFMFLNGFIRGNLQRGVAFDMRISMFKHIQNLSYTYHNNADTGDLIQRCTSDNDTVKTFLSAQLPQLLYIIGSFTFGAVQMALINRTIMLVTHGGRTVTLTASIIYFRYIRKKKFELVEELKRR